jgi:hypothetical protein
MSKTLQQIKDEYAVDCGYDTFNAMFTIDRITSSDVTAIATRYARACCEATLEKAAKNVWAESEWMMNDLGREVQVFSPPDQKSILNSNNIVIL